jgi:hypothetical protein
MQYISNIADGALAGVDTFHLRERAQRLFDKWSVLASADAQDADESLDRTLVEDDEDDELCGGAELPRCPDCLREALTDADARIKALEDDLEAEVKPRWRRLHRRDKVITGLRDERDAARNKVECADATREAAEAARDDAYADAKAARVELQAA